MALSRQTPSQDIATDTPLQDGTPGMQQSPWMGLASTMGNAAMQGMMLGAGNLGVAAAAGAGAGAVAAATTQPTTEYVDMGSRTSKAGYLVGLMNDSRGLLDANGVSEHMESKLAGIMTNEGSRNLRRQNLGNGFLDQARALQGQLKGVDMAALNADPKKLEAFNKGLTEEQRHLFGMVQGGSLDLSQIGKDNSKVPAALRQQVTEAGITLRANQYQEMNDLMAAQSTGKLDKTQAARLKTLSGLRGGSQIGMAGDMGQLAGMSKERFTEIFQEGQQRFEPAQYAALRASYQRNKAAQKDPNADVKMASGIGSFKMDKAAQDQLAGNSDLIADMATSYGTAQIMGAYAQQGLLSAKGADKENHTFTLDELKASGDRLSPNSTDVQMQLAFMNMKGLSLGSKDMTNEKLTEQYNGSKPGSDLYKQYLPGLRDGSSAYLTAKAKGKTP